MKITWAPMALMAELRRTTTGEDPARRYGVFRNMGPTYLYKVLPDGSTARDDDNEFPHLNALDNVVLGYAVHRFKDPFAAWIQKESGWLPAEWEIPVLEFLWSDATVVPRDPAATTEAELPREPPLPGSRPPRDAERLGQGRDLDRVLLRAVLREARPPRHEPVRDLPQGLPGHRRRRRLHRHGEPALPEPLPAHRSPTTRCWSTSRGSASSGARTSGRRRTTAASAWTRRASGTRCGASRTGERTRDLWDRGRIVAYDAQPGRYVYARGDGTRAYQPTQDRRLRARAALAAQSNVLFVLDRVTSRDAGLQEGVAAPRRRRAQGRGRRPARPRPSGQGGTATPERHARDLRGRQAAGCGVHALLPARARGRGARRARLRVLDPGGRVRRRLGHRQELAPRSPRGRSAADRSLSQEDVADVLGGRHGSGSRPRTAERWFPGAGGSRSRPARPAREDVFLHALEIGDKGAPPRRIEAIAGHGLVGRGGGGRRGGRSSRPGRRPTRPRPRFPTWRARLAPDRGLEAGALLRPAAHLELRPGLAALALRGAANDAGDHRRALGAEGRAACGCVEPGRKELDDEPIARSARWPSVRPCRGVRVAATRPRPAMPKITKPVMFDTPEADAILAALQVFPPDNPWNQDISGLPVHKDSAAMIASHRRGQGPAVQPRHGLHHRSRRPEAGGGEDPRLPGRSRIPGPSPFPTTLPSRTGP